MRRFRVKSRLDPRHSARSAENLEWTFAGLGTSPAHVVSFNQARWPQTGIARLSRNQNSTRPDGRKKAQEAQKIPQTRGSVFALSALLYRRIIFLREDFFVMNLIVALRVSAGTSVRFA